MKRLAASPSHRLRRPCGQSPCRQGQSCRSCRCRSRHHRREALCSGPSCGHTHYTDCIAPWTLDLIRCRCLEVECLMTYSLWARDSHGSCGLVFCSSCKSRDPCCEADRIQKPYGPPGYSFCKRMMGLLGSPLRSDPLMWCQHGRERNQEREARTLVTPATFDVLGVRRLIALVRTVSGFANEIKTSG